MTNWRKSFPKMNKIILLILLTVISGASFAEVFTTVQVQEVENQALYRQNTNQQWQNLTEGVTLKAGYEIKTLQKTRLVIRFGQYGVVRIAPQSHLKINPSQAVEKQSFELVFGRAWAKIKHHLKGSSARLILKTRNVAIRIKGTAYEASFKDGETHVRVFSGQVNVQSQQEQRGSLKPTEIEGPYEVSQQEWSMVVNAFESVVVSGKNLPSSPTAFQLDPSDQWANWNLQQDQSF